MCKIEALGSLFRPSFVNIVAMCSAKGAETHPDVKRRSMPASCSAVRSSIKIADAAQTQPILKGDRRKSYAPPRKLHMTHSLLASRRFAPLFWRQFFAAFNDNFLKNALVLLDPGADRPRAARRSLRSPARPSSRRSFFCRRSAANSPTNMTRRASCAGSASPRSAWPHWPLPAFFSPMSPRSLARSFSSASPARCSAPSNTASCPTI